MKKGMKRLLAAGWILFLVGILGIAVSFLIGRKTGVWDGHGFWRGTASIEETYENGEIQHIALHMGAGKVRIRLGDRFSISGQGLYEDFRSQVEDGVWSVGQSGEGGSFLRNLFHSSGQVTLTVPADFPLDSLSLEIGAGQLETEALAARYLEVTCGAGQVEIRQMQADEIYVHCGVGEVELSLEGREEDYPLDVRCGAGEVTVGGREYGGLGRGETSAEEPRLHITCGVGKVGVRFTEPGDRDF